MATPSAQALISCLISCLNSPAACLVSRSPVRRAAQFSLRPPAPSSIPLHAGLHSTASPKTQTYASARLSGTPASKSFLHTWERKSVHRILSTATWFIKKCACPCRTCQHLTFNLADIKLTAARLPCVEGVTRSFQLACERPQLFSASSPALQNPSRSFLNFLGPRFLGQRKIFLVQPFQQMENQPLFFPSIP